jgi:hypothetical protein
VERVDRGDVDDPPAARLLDHQLGHVLCAEEEPAEVDGDHAIEVRGAHL